VNSYGVLEDLAKKSLLNGRTYLYSSPTFHIQFVAMEDYGAKGANTVLDSVYQTSIYQMNTKRLSPVTSGALVGLLDLHVRTRTWQAPSSKVGAAIALYFRLWIFKKLLPRARYFGSFGTGC